MLIKAYLRIIDSALHMNNYILKIRLKKIKVTKWDLSSDAIE